MHTFVYMYSNSFVSMQKHEKDKCQHRVFKDFASTAVMSEINSENVVFKISINCSGGDVLFVLVTK